MQHFVVGIDPSLSRTGIAICPLDWGGDWTKVRVESVATTSFGKSAHDRVARYKHIVGCVMNILEEHATRAVRSVFIEDYAYSRSNKAHHMGEFGGVLRMRLDGPVGPAEVGIQAARKRLLGKVPREGAKVAVYEALVAAGGKFLSLDESDAMCVCNYGLSELGGFCFMGAQ